MLIELTDATSCDETIINTEAIERITKNVHTYYDGELRSDNSGSTIQLRSGMTLHVTEGYDEIKNLLKKSTEI